MDGTVQGICELLSRLGDRVLSAAYCQKRLGDLSIEWRALWQRVEELPADEVRSRWQSLAQRLNDATAHKATETIDKRFAEAERGARADIEAARRILRREGGQPAAEDRLDEVEEYG